MKCAEFKKDCINFAYKPKQNKKAMIKFLKPE